MRVFLFLGLIVLLMGVCRSMEDAALLEKEDEIDMDDLMNRWRGRLQRESSQRSPTTVSLYYMRQVEM